jgi:hypothetical protein
MRTAMPKQTKKLIVPVAATILSLIVARAVAAPDEGEARATEQYRQLPRCATVVQYGNQPTPIGPATGDLEKDTYAYRVTHTSTVCGAAQP